jgi:Calx-beta domain
MRLVLAALMGVIALLVPATSAFAAPALTVNDVTVTEGDSGQQNATFTVTMSETASTPVTVNYGTADDTARQPGDYTQTSGVLTIAPGDTSNTILVPVKGDTLDEIDETFDLNLSSASGATISDSRGVGRITDDDPAPTLSITDVSRSEGNVNLGFSVRLSRASGRDVTVNYATANGSAVAPGDYTAASGSVTIPAGSTSRTVNVGLREDTLDEPNETFTLNLSNASGATISDGSGRGTISDDDAAPSLAIRDTGVAEGRVAGFLVALSRASGRTITVRYTTGNRSALAGSDYAAASGTLTIPAGRTSGAVFIRTIGDRRDEANETFRVVLSRASNARISDSTGQATIIDDDPRPNARPRLSRLSVRPFAFRVAATVRWVQSERARVTIRLQRRVGRRWRTRRGAVVRSGRAGANRLRLVRRWKGRRLPAGRYRLVFVAVDRQGARSAVRRVVFRIRA